MAQFTITIPQNLGDAPLAELLKATAAIRRAKALQDGIDAEIKRRLIPGAEPVSAGGLVAWSKEVVSTSKDIDKMVKVLEVHGELIPMKTNTAVRLFVK